jgi:hypothetical protein
VVLGSRRGKDILLVFGREETLGTTCSWKRKRKRLLERWAETGCLC